MHGFSVIEKIDSWIRGNKFFQFNKSLIYCFGVVQNLVLSSISKGGSATIIWINLVKVLNLDKVA